eukprot:scpid66010/ scgid2013/ Peroxisomal membrane protein PEX14; PTS1 receptor-docking protein; Peroxin-14; Peroxisomal membrane anchor protein PEX14
MALDGNEDTSKVDIAVRFLSHSDIQKANVDKKKEFLRKRGLNEGQITEALFRSSMQQSSAGASSSSPAVGSDHLHSGGRPWLAYSVLLGMLTLAGAGFVHLYEAYILPYLQRREQEETRLQGLEAALGSTQSRLNDTVDGLQTSVSAIQESVRRIEQDVTTIKCSSSQTSSREDAMAGVKSEIQTVKSLLLSRNQFASAPVQRPSIPAWQRTNGTSSSAAAASPTNGVNGDSANGSSSESASPNDGEDSNGTPPNKSPLSSRSQDPGGNEDTVSPQCMPKSLSPAVRTAQPQDGGQQPNGESS